MQIVCARLTVVVNMITSNDTQEEILKEALIEMRKQSLQQCIDLCQLQLRNTSDPRAIIACMESIRKLQSLSLEI